MELFHALDGMRIISSTQQLVDSVQYILNNNNIEICCTNLNGIDIYGDISIAVKGHVSHMFHCDVCSSIDSNGKRFCCNLWMDDECNEEEFIHEEMPEAWVTIKEILFIRIKKYAGRRKLRHYTERYDMDLLESLNIPIVIV